MTILQILFLSAPVIYIGTLFYRIRKAEHTPLDSDEYPYDGAYFQSIGGELPAFLVIWLIMASLFGQWKAGLLYFLQFSTEILLLMSIYYALLLPSLPFLRKHFTARACAMLWMLPSALYCAGVMISYQRRYANWVIYIPQTALYIFYAVWLVGFLVMILYYIIGHLRFRRQLLRDAVPAEGAAKALWETELENIQWNGTIPLMVSPHITTPLVIGLRAKKLIALLPDRRYCVAEYRLIYRHELRHVVRQDSENKFFWCFCRALFWFNPLIWVAARRASEDLELSCDEYVLEEADADTRRLYAGLLLDTAGDSRGFSTCLSAAAGTLRHRMKCAVAPRKLRSGGLLLICVMILLTFCNGLVTISGSRGKLGDYVVLDGNLLYRADVSYLQRGIENRGDSYSYDPGEGEMFAAYLSDLPVTKLPEISQARDDSVPGSAWYTFYFGRTKVLLSENWITVEYGRSAGRKNDWIISSGYTEDSFRIDTELDWEVLGHYVAPISE